MARDFGIIRHAFWEDQKIRSLSPCGLIVMNYLMTCRHGNAVGCFRLPIGYAEVDLAPWLNGIGTVSEGFHELSEAGLIRYEEGSQHVLIRNFLRHNRIDNANVAKMAVRLVEECASATGGSPIFHELIERIRVLEPPHLIDQMDGIETVSKRYRKKEPEPEPEKEPEPERESGAVAPPAGDEVGEAVEAYNELADEIGLSRVQRVTDQRRAKLRARLREVGGLDGWRHALGRIRGSPFLRGQNNRNWRAGLDFLLQESSFTKLMEGAYDDRTNDDFRGFDDMVSAVVAGGLDGGHAGAGDLG